MTVALTQVVLAADDLADSVALWRSALGLGVGVRDPEMGKLGLDHRVLGIGDDTVLEIISPARADVPVARLLGRLGGACGYMLALHVRGADYDAWTGRLAEMAITPAMVSGFRASRLVQLHPREFGTLLQISFLDARWHWVEELTPETTGTVADAITAVQIAVADPDNVCATWRRLLDLPGAGPGIELDHGTVEFVPVTQRAGLCGMTVRAVDRRRAGEQFAAGGMTVRFA